MARRHHAGPTCRHVQDVYYMLLADGPLDMGAGWPPRVLQDGLHVHQITSGHLWQHVN